jgi:hypothetical protein
MAARIKIKFVRSHHWHPRSTFSVVQRPGSNSLSLAESNWFGDKPIWPIESEQGGLGFDEFGAGEFGWLNPIDEASGFGEGLFGAGEFGYFNSLVTCESPRRCDDGRHVLALTIRQPYGLEQNSITEWPFLVTSIPSPPAAIIFNAMSDGDLSVKWIGSDDV